MSTGPSWKHSGGQPSNRPATSRKTWQPGQTPAAKKPGSPSGRHRMRVVAGGLSLTALIGLIIFLIYMFMPPKTPSLVVVAPSAADSTAAPSNAASGAADLATEFDTKKSRPRTAGAPDAKATIADWFRHVDAKTKLPVVLHFACPGAADKDGPFLWFVPADADAAEPGHKLRVADILTYVEQTLDRERPVLLIFDAATEQAAWARGQLHNDFARQLRGLDTRIKGIPNLVVICSADEDQRSWVAEERRQTAFAHYLREALRGVGFQPSDRITAKALFDVVQKNVFDWAQANRDAPQKPFLLPTADPERANQMVVVTLGPDDAKPAAIPTGGGYPEALKAAWRRQAKRAEQSPPPEATAPHVWRQYLDLLLKADRAARATRGELPAEVQERLAALETELDVRPWAGPPDCVPYALPAATALWEPRTKEFSTADVAAVLAAANRQAAWADLAGRVNPGDRQRPEVRLAGADAVLKYLLSNQTRLDQKALEDAAELLRLIDDGAAARPVEAHLIQMFALHLKNRDPELVRQAIRTQIAAEHAAWLGGDPKLYPHAEQVARWFGADLRNADVRRRELTDLVFAATAKDVAGEGMSDGQRVPLAEALEKNRKDYEALAAKAAALGNAYRLRDRVLSRLPYYARWAAARRLPTATAEPILKQIEALADLVHQLTDWLEDPMRRDLKEVTDKANSLQAGDATNPGFDLLEKTFRAQCAAMSENAVPANWHAIDAALEVPFIAPDDRKTLFDKAMSISRGLESTGSPTGAAATTVVPQEMAQRQGRMAVAVLGIRGLGARTGGKSKNEVESLIREPSKSAWWESLTDAGAEIGAAFNDLPKKAAEQVKEGAQRTPEAAPEQNRQAAALARLIDGATRLPAKTINPVAEERRYWTHRLLIDQALRSAADGWADYKAGKTGYSAAAAQKYLDSAEAILFSGSPIRASERERWKSKFPKSLPRPEFTFNTQAEFAVTNQLDQPLPFTVTPTGEAAGYPALRVRDIVLPVTPEKLKPDTYGVYDPVGRFVGPQAAPQNGVVSLGVGKAKDGDEGGVQLDLLYRGWVTTKTVKAVFAGTPYYEWVYTPSRVGAKIAVRGDDAFRTGAVAFLVDCSKSMKQNEKFSKTSAALRDILKKLPKDTMVSVHYFAESEGEDGRLTPVLTPTNWVRPEAQANDLYTKLDARTPDGDYTPISAAVRNALTTEKVFAKTPSGHCSLIVLTDGAENTRGESWRKPTDGPGRSMIATLREVQKVQDVALHLMLIGISEEEYGSARIQFGAIEDPGRNDASGTLPVIWPREVGGKLVDELKESADLVAAVRESMLPQIVIRDSSNREVGRLPVSIPSTDGHWAWLRKALPAGSYRLSLARSRQAAYQELNLEAGDRIILKLRQTGSGLDFVLPSYADVMDGLGGLDRTSPKHGRLEMTVPRNFLTPHGSDFDLQMTATLENPLVEEGKLRAGLRRLQPVFAWFDIAPQAGSVSPKWVRVENLNERFAPAWRLTTGPWISGGNVGAAAAATVTGYWLDSTPATSGRLVLERANALTDAQKKRQVSGTEIQIRQIVARGGTIQIDLDHAKGQPVVVRVALTEQQRRRIAERHLFFDNAQYTATFEGFTPEELSKELTLEFCLISEIKNQAVTDKTKLFVDVKSPPRADRSNDLLPEQADGSK